MTGSIRQVRPGSWELRVNAGRDAVYQKRTQISVTIQGSKRDAERALVELLSENDRGKLAGTSATFRYLAEEWLKKAGDDLSPTTLRRYEILLRKHIYPAIGDLKLRKIKTIDLDRLYGGLHTQVRLSPATVRQVHAIIRRAFKQGMMWGWVRENPAANATPPRMTKPDPSPPNAFEVGELIRVASELDPELGHFLFLSATTGARRGEMCALRWSDVDFEAGAVTIQRAIIELSGGGIMEKDTKTHSSRRIALDEFSQSVLVTQRHLETTRAAIVGLRIRDDAFIFSREPDGSAPWLPNWMTQRFIKIRDDLATTKCDCTTSDTLPRPV